MFAYLSVCLMAVSQSVWLSVSLCLPPSLCLSDCLPVSVYQSVYLTQCWHDCLPVCLSDCLMVCLSVCNCLCWLRLVCLHGCLSRSMHLFFSEGRTWHMVLHVATLHSFVNMYFKTNVTYLVHKRCPASLQCSDRCQSLDHMMHHSDTYMSQGICNHKSLVDTLLNQTINCQQIYTSVKQEAKINSTFLQNNTCALKQ